MGLQQSAGCRYTFVTHYTRFTYTHVLHKYIYTYDMRREVTSVISNSCQIILDFFFVNSCTSEL